MNKKKLIRKSIFDLERRVNLWNELIEFDNDSRKTHISINSFRRITLREMMDESICDWPYRESARSISSFCEKHFYDSNLNLLFHENELAIYRFELYINLLYWAPTHYDAQKNPFDFDLKESPLGQKLLPFIENISFLMEENNMVIRKKEMENCPQYVVTKRDEDVDATIDIVPELSEFLLSYLDCRNQKDEMFKKNTIKAIADYLEPKRESFKGTGYKGLCDDVFYSFNRLGIRHNNERQVALRKDKRMKLYDVLFRMSLHLIQKERIDECRHFIQTIKDGSKGQC